MRISKTTIFIIGIILIALNIGFFSGEVKNEPGILVPVTPKQSKVSLNTAKKKLDEYVISPLATFSITARVLSTARYRFDRSSKLVPVDLALGWGPMSDNNLLDRLKIWQSGRFYFWKTRDRTISIDDVVTNSANMHLIPANTKIRSLIKKARKGNIVSFSGYLVEVRTAKGFSWTSSLTRNDTGAGACELVWIEQFRIVK